MLEWHFVVLDDTPTDANSLHLFTDASGSIGFGGFFEGNWFSGVWSDQKLPKLSDEYSIAFKELYPIVIAAMLWGKRWSRKRIMFHCDNLATVYILNKGRSPCPHIMKLMRRLVITATLHNFNFLGEHVPGVKNSIADALSRLHFQDFRRLAPEANLLPCQIPSNVMFD